MKKLFFLICCISLMQVSFSQTEFGIKAGATVAQENFSSDQYTSNPRIGVHAGLTFRYLFLEMMALQTGLLLSMEGTKEEHSMGGEGHISRTYLHLPLLYQYMITRQLMLEAGMHLAYMISAKETFSGNEHDILEYYKKLHTRLALGLGFSLTESLLLNLRFTHSLGHINKDAVLGDKIRAMAIFLSLQYRLK